MEATNSVTVRLGIVFSLLGAIGMLAALAYEESGERLELGILAAAVLAVFFLVRAVRTRNSAIRRLRLLSLMHIEVNRAVSSHEDIEDIYRKILDFLFMMFPNVRYGSILVLDENGDFRFASYRGFAEDYVRGFRLRLEDAFIYQQSGGKVTRAVIINRTTLKRAYTRFRPVGWNYKSVISAPLFLEGRLFGLLNLDSEKPRFFDAEDLRTVEQFSAQIEVCLLARGNYRKKLEKSSLDSLTDLYTRARFEELFEHVIERARRYGEAFILAIFDADGLKAVNDTHGHLAGDALLVALAQALRDSHRKSDVLGRFGGDEFIAVYHGSDKEAMSGALEAVRGKLRQEPPLWENQPLDASFCFGLACFPDDGEDLRSLTSVADQELYKRKRERKNSRKSPPQA